MSLAVTSQFNMPYFPVLEYTDFSYNDDNGLPTVIRQTMDVHNFLNSLGREENIITISQDDSLDTEIQDLILEYDWIKNIKTDKNFDESDSDSVMLDYDNLDFLDNNIECKSEPILSSSPISIQHQPPLRDTSIDRQASDSSWSTDSSMIPKFENICPSLESDDSGESSSSSPLSSSSAYHSDTDNDIGFDDKPYCSSNRGAKHNLLWKFILQVLDDRDQRMVSWVDKKDGIFKFDDTATFSKKWGERKRKGDMNFEKLSRGIRHYYKSGLMSRISSERLVYKFDWMKVPKRQRRV